MSLNEYRFRSSWRLDDEPDDVFQALRNVDDYPAWWRQVRSATPLGDMTYDMVVRSTLPYDLAFRSERAVDDPDGRVLQATMTGDLEGFSRFTAKPADGGGTELVFEEEVVVRKVLLRRLAFVAKPAFIANHQLMMRDGERGLRTYLAGRRSARVPEVVGSGS